MLAMRCRVLPNTGKVDLMTVVYPFNDAGSLELHESYFKALRTPGLLRVQLPHGDPAWLATRYDDVRLVLGDRRFRSARC